MRSERWKSHFQGPRFQNFPGEDTPGPPPTCARFCSYASVSPQAGSTPGTFIVSSRFTLFDSSLYFSSPNLEPGGANAFYRSALKCPQLTCWYSNVPVGHNKLAPTVKWLCDQAEISGYRTYHSLRATAATRMYDMGINEQLICEKTGERTEVIKTYL